MNGTLQTYEQRREDARKRLTAALRPAGRGERELVDYLVNGLSTPGSLDTLTAMVEQAVRQATANGYETGWRDGWGEQ